MKCPEIIIDRRSNPPRTSICNKEIYGITGLQELQNFQKHLRSKHGQQTNLREAMEYRAESEQ